MLQNDSGGLVNGLVTPNSLSTATKTLIAATWVPRGLWVTASAYTVGDVVDNTSGGITTSYVCAVSHTSGTLATDVSAGKWNTLGATVTGAASSVSFSATGTIAATNVQSAIAEAAAEALQISSNLSDLGSAATARSNLAVPSKAELQQQTVFVASAGGTANAITASYTPAPTVLVDKMRFRVVAGAANSSTTPTFTPNSGTITAKTIVKGANAALVAGDVPGQYAVCDFQYNSTLDKWVLTNPAAVSGSLATVGGTMSGDITMSGASVIEVEGADVASASSCNIWATDGNTVHITGAVTIADFGTAPQAGAWMKVVFDAALTLTNSGSLILNNGGSNITTAGGDVGFVYADTTAIHRLYLIKKSGAAVNTATPRGYISGFTQSNNAGDAVNDLDIAAGIARDATDAHDIAVTSAYTKQSDANWAVGSAAGALDTGAVANSDYYIWAIKRSDTGVSDYLFSLSSTAPTMPTNYDYKRLIGWFKRVGGTIVAFTVYETEGGGIELNWNVPTLDINSANSLTTARRTDAVKVPLNFSTIAHLNVSIMDASNHGQVNICCPDQTDAAPSDTAAPLGNAGNIDASANARATQLRVRTSAAGLIAARSALATVDLYAVATIGFTWARKN